MICLDRNRLFTGCTILTSPGLAVKASFRNPEKTGPGQRIVTGTLSPISLRRLSKYPLKKRRELESLEHNIIWLNRHL